MIPGEIRTAAGPVEVNAGRRRTSLVVVNTGDRPIQVGSHLHLPGANAALQFDREAAQGFRLDVPAGTSVRFEPGVSRQVDLVALGGAGRVPGLQIRGREVSAHRRPPKRVVPFGTPGTEVQAPGRASPMHTRLSDEPPAAVAPPPEGEDDQ